MKIKKRNKVDLRCVDIRAVVDQLGIRVKHEHNNHILAWCIFHEDGKVPNLSIQCDSGGPFYCFSCGASGNVLGLVERGLGVDRSKAWAYLSDSVGVISATAESIRRGLNRRKRGDILFPRKKIDELLDELYTLLELPPGVSKAIRLAAREWDIDRYFHLMDSDYEMLRLLIDDLACWVDDYKWWIERESSLSDVFMRRVFIIKEFVNKSGYIGHHKKRFFVDPEMYSVGLARWKAKSGIESAVIA